MNAKRVCFKGKGAKIFFSRILNGKSLKKFCKEHNFEYWAFTHYCRGEYTLPLPIFEKLCHIDSSAVNGLKFEIITQNWWQCGAGKKGIKGLAKKYGKKTLRKWRSNMKKYRLDNTKKPHLPKTVYENLAELVGVYLGDGTLAKNFIRVTGDKRYDRPYFEYLNRLTHKIFGIIGAIREEKQQNQLYFEIRSKIVSDYFQNTFNFNCCARNLMPLGM